MTVSVRYCLIIIVGSALALPGYAQTVTKGTFHALNKVQELIDQENYGQAVADLEELIGKMRNKGYDFALANRYLAHASVLADKPKRARTALEAALGASELPPELVLELKLFYGQILVGEEQFERALPVLEEWFAAAERPSADQIFSLAYANYMNDRKRRARELIGRAIAESKSPPDSWYQLLYQVLFDLKQYKLAEETALVLVGRNPSNASHWRILANHYLQLERDNEALAALMVAYQQSLLSSKDDLKRLTVLHSYAGIPEKAARLLDEWLKSERLPTNAETLKQLGDLWLYARERDNAKEALLRAAKMASDGQAYESLGRVYFEDDEWRNAYLAFQDALRRGGVDNPAEVHLLAGISAFRAQMIDEARVSLSRAAKTEKYRSQARDLLQKLDES